MDGTLGDVGPLLSFSRRKVEGLSGRVGPGVVEDTAVGTVGLVQVVSSVFKLKKYVCPLLRDFRSSQSGGSPLVDLLGLRAMADAASGSDSSTWGAIVVGR